MHLYEVGKPYIPGTRRFKEGVDYNYRQGAHELPLFFGRLTDSERAAIRTGPCEFALAVHGPVIFLLYKFDQAIPWSDAPYTWHMVPAEQRSTPAELAPGQGVLLHVILVNAETGIVEALRAVSLSPHFSRRLHEAIRLQAARPFDQATYDQALAGLYQRYPTSEALLATAIARTHGGD